MSRTTQGILVIAAMAVAAMITRSPPFVLFPAGKKTPKYTEHLGKSLSYVTMRPLVVYCLKGVSLTAAPFGAPEILVTIAIILLHNWKRNSLLNIGAETVLYMTLVRVVLAQVEHPVKTWLTAPDLRRAGATLGTLWGTDRVLS